MFLLDVNGFKRINDVHGHGIGDELLIVVAHRLASSVRDGDLVARFGGDEFAILARHIEGGEVATSVALRVIQLLQTPIQMGSLMHQVNVGIGIALAPQDGSDADEILRKADVALYRAKAERRSALRFFEEQMDRSVRERESAAIVSALVGLGSGLGLSVAAEGIDETQQRALLLGSGCVQGQGQLFGDAISADATVVLVENFASLSA